MLREAEVDLNDTAKRRARMTDTADPPALYDPWPRSPAVRKRLERRTVTALANFLLTLPQPFRAYAKREIHRRIDRDHEAAPPDATAIPALWAEINRRMDDPRGISP